MTKDEFLRGASPPSGNYRVYVESIAKDRESPLEGQTLKGSFGVVSMALEDCRAFIIGFDASKKRQAEEFVELCRQDKGLRVVEGPELVQ